MRLAQDVGDKRPNANTLQRLWCLPRQPTNLGGSVGADGFKDGLGNVVFTANLPTTTSLAFEKAITHRSSPVMPNVKLRGAPLLARPSRTPC